ncbi:condensation domain-containing protein [Clostridium sp. LP20]|uniref:condensation domain-containing protein n=1 Tax=Clostridium sp. LP20 TaxID=3418665 RepID=UPI003EE62D8F
MNDFIDNLMKLNEEEKIKMLSIIRERGDEFNIYPLSAEQSRLWFLYKLNKDDSSYNVTYNIYIEGRLEKEILEKALTELVERQKVFTTTIFSLNSEHFQLVNKIENIKLDEIDISKEIDKEKEFNKHVQKMYNSSFSLENEFPFRMKLIKTNIEENNLIVVLHHIFCDGYSMGIFYKMLKELYKKYSGEKYDDSILENINQYHMYIKDKQNYDYSKSKKYWGNKMRGANLKTTLPNSYPSTIWNEEKAIIKKRELNKREEIMFYCKKQKISLFSFMLGVYGLLLKQFSNETNITVGTPTLNRDDDKWRNTIGFFANTMAVNFKIDENLDISHYLKNINKIVLDSLDHSDLQFDDLVDSLSVRRNQKSNPVFSSMFALQNNILFGKNDTSSVGNIKMNMKSPEHEYTMQFDLMVTVIETNEKIVLDIAAKKSIFSDRRVNEMLEMFEIIIEKLCNQELNFIREIKLEIPLEDMEESNIKNIKEKCMVEIINSCSDAPIDKIEFYRDVTYIYCKDDNEKVLHEVNSVMRKITNTAVVFVKKIEKIGELSGIEKCELYRDIYNKIKSLLMKCENDSSLDEFYFIYNNEDIELYVLGESINENYYDYGDEIKVHMSISCETNDNYNEDEYSESEERMLVIWKSILGIKKMTKYDDFFALGGKSIKMIELFDKVNQIYPGKITINDLFSYSTVYKLIQFIEGNEVSDTDEEFIMI